MYHWKRWRMIGGTSNFTIWRASNMKCKVSAQKSSLEHNMVIKNQRYCFRISKIHLELKKILSLL